MDNYSFARLLAQGMPPDALAAHAPGGYPVSFQPAPQTPMEQPQPTAYETLTHLMSIPNQQKQPGIANQVGSVLGGLAKPFGGMLKSGNQPSIAATNPSYSGISYASPQMADLFQGY